MYSVSEIWADEIAVTNIQVYPVHVNRISLIDIRVCSRSKLKFKQEHESWFKTQLQNTIRAVHCSRLEICNADCRKNPRSQKPTSAQLTAQFDPWRKGQHAATFLIFSLSVSLNFCMFCYCFFFFPCVIHLFLSFLMLLYVFISLSSSLSLFPYVILCFY